MTLYLVHPLLFDPAPNTSCFFSPFFSLPGAFEVFNRGSAWSVNLWRCSTSSRLLQQLSCLTTANTLANSSKVRPVCLNFLRGGRGKGFTSFRQKASCLFDLHEASCLFELLIFLPLYVSTPDNVLMTMTGFAIPENKSSSSSMG
jgi:hypothetical protein